MRIPALTRRVSATAILLAATSLVAPAGATIVRFATVLGNVDVRLYDAATPLNVANFLNYVTSGRYDGTFIHRKSLNFVVQGGGFYYDPTTNTAPEVEKFPMVMNEFGITNARGTIAMAKLPPPEQGGPPDGGPNSATSQWFFNTKDNGTTSPGFLDTQNGGFTVFGRVVGNGMNVIDAINALPIADLDPPPQRTFDTVPIRDVPGGLVNNLIFVNSITVRDLPAGDYDFNGTVNTADYDAWKSTFGSTTSAAADGNGNGRVDAGDYTIWRDTLGQSSGAGASALTTVPEPAAAVLLILAATASSACPRRRRRANFRPID